MRKGRSSRRSRTSRPLVGVKAPSLPGEAEAGTPVDVIIPKLPPLSGGLDPLDPLAALESLEKVSVAPSSHLDAGPSEDAPSEDAPSEDAPPSVNAAESDPEAAMETQRSIAPPASEPARVDELPLALANPQPVVDLPPAVDADKKVLSVSLSPSESLRRAQPVEETTQLEESAAREDAHAAASIDPDEISVPPIIGDVTVETFFSEGELARRAAADAIDVEALTVTDKAKRKSEPYVVERRARFARYVRWAVIGAAVVCIAAVARTTTSSATSGTRIAASESAATKEAVAAAAPIGDPAIGKAAATTTTIVPATADPAAAIAAPSPEPAAPSPEPVAPKASDVAAATEEVTGDAKEEKTKARMLLERRKLADAIEAGERSVKLDPSDGEAWLILGAAYQEKGNIVEARRAYAACVKEGKTGPRTECAKMLR